MQVRLLTRGDEALARTTFAVMAETFGESDSAALSEGHVALVLARHDFLAFAAVDGDVVGGLTAHVLPMTRAATFEVFLYDIAVKSDRQRQGVGRALVRALREEASRRGIDDVFVAADDEDDHALDFYRALGGRASKVTMFDL